MNNANRPSQTKGHSDNATKTAVTNNSSVSKRRVDAEKAALKLRERNNLDRQQTALRRQKEFTEKTQLWNEHILPKWSELSQSPKVRDLCSKGIPPNIRGKVWPLLIGNELQVDEKLFEDLNRKVLLIYGNKVAASLRKRSGDSVDGDEESGMHKDATYKVFKDSFSSAEEDADDFTPRSQRSATDEEDRLDAAARSISKDIPIPLLHQRLTARSLRSGGMVSGMAKAQPVPLLHASHLDITEESWFQNERNGSLDSETFELIQKQLFKAVPGGGSLHMDVEEQEEDDEIQDDGAVSSYAESEGNSMRHAGIAAMCGTDSVESHFTLGSYSVIGSYLAPSTRAQHTDQQQQQQTVERSIALNINGEVTSLSNPLTLQLTPNYAKERQDGEEDLDEMSFALATGGDTLSSRGLGSRPQSMSSPVTPFLLEQDQSALSLLHVAVEEVEEASDTPAHAYYSQSLVGSAGQWTPPPRRRHSEGYLIQVGLIEESVGDDEAAAGINRRSPVLSPKLTTLGGTPLKTILPFPVPNIAASAGTGRPPMPPPKAAHVPRRESPVLGAAALEVGSVAEAGGSEPKRRTSVSALTAQFQVMEDLAAQAEQQKRQEEADVVEARRRELAISAALAKSEEELSTQKKLSNGDVASSSDAKLLNTMCLIEWDLPRTFPTLGFFHDGGPMHTGLERILLCYACFRPEIGYVQGMSFLVATLLLYMDEFEAFKCLANLLGRRVNMDFYRLKREAIDSYVRCFDHFFKKSLPLLYQHMSGEGVTSEMFLMDWNMALFTKALPLEVAAQVWDMYLFEGEMYIMCVGLGILKMFAPKLSTFGVEQISPFLLHLPERINPEELFLNVSQIQIPKKTYERVRKKMAEQARVEQEHQNGLRRNKSATHLSQNAHADGAADHKQSSAFPLGSSIKRALLDARDNLIGTVQQAPSVGSLTPPPQHTPPLVSAHKRITSDNAEDADTVDNGGMDSVSEAAGSHSLGSAAASRRRGSLNSSGGPGHKKSGLECLQS